MWRDAWGGVGPCAAGVGVLGSRERLAHYTGGAPHFYKGAQTNKAGLERDLGFLDSVG